MPLISVIVTTYNRQELLTQTINSILNQTFQDFELIVVDNCSSYDFFTHLESFKSEKIKGFQNHNNGIIAVNRNYGLNYVTGSYVAFCDDDDIWLPTKLHKQVEIFEKSENKYDKVLIYSEVILFGENKKEVLSNRKSVKNINQLMKRNEIPLSSTLISYSAQIKFDEDQLLITCEDFDLWLKLIKEGYSLFYIEEPLIKYRLSSNSAYNSNAQLVHIRKVYTLIKHVLKHGFSGINLLNYILVVCVELFKYYLKTVIVKFKQ